MKKFFALIAILTLSSGCAMLDWVGLGGPAGPSPQEVARRQFDDGQAAFARKLGEARGKPLPRLRDEWGGLDDGPSLDGLSVYQWRQTARIIPPADGDSPPGATLASCLAMFIVQHDVVMDATSEGQCFDFRLMPAWKPYITQSTDGRIGEVLP